MKPIALLFLLWAVSKANAKKALSPLTGNSGTLWLIDTTGSVVTVHDARSVPILSYTLKPRRLLKVFNDGPQADLAQHDFNL